MTELSNILKLTHQRWEGIEKLGEGGQGEVFKVRSKAGRDERAEALNKVIYGLTHMTDSNQFATRAAEIVEGISLLSNRDDDASLGALKVFKPREHSQTEQRFRREVEALKVIRDPGIVKLLDADITGGWTVTRYCSGGTLDDVRSRFTGKAQRALSAIRPVVAGVAKLHAFDPTHIHRDIKPKNVLVAGDGSLVLGDFGIVFFDSAQRPTETLERVGSRDWMPPWAHAGRIEDVTPAFDVYMLGKVLWWMMSGTFMLREWHRQPNRPEYNLEALFPEDPWMARVNDILDACLVEDMGDCVPDAGQLLARIESCLKAIERGGQPLGAGLRRHCTVCGLGTYETIEAMEGKERDPRPRLVALPTSTAVRTAQQVLQVKGWFLPGETHGATVRVFACDQCGHMQLFKLDEDRDRGAWLPKHGPS